MEGNSNFYIALFVTFFVSGFWHGAGWTFVIWGVINGLFVIASHMMNNANMRLPFFLAWTMTFIGVISTRVLFVSNDFTDAGHVLVQMFSFSNFENTVHLATTQPLYLLIGMILVLAFPNSTHLLSKYRPTVKYAFATAMLLTVSLLNMSYARGFLYFQF